MTVGVDAGDTLVIVLHLPWRVRAAGAIAVSRVTRTTSFRSHIFTLVVPSCFVSTFL
jgi:hypothetical protein